MLEKQLIHKAFANYDLGPIVKEPKYIKGDVDYNYILTTDTGRYFLKYIVNKTNLRQFELLGSVHEYLKQGGNPVPKIFKTKQGNYVQDDFILYEFIDGEIKKDWTTGEIISLSTNFARMHGLLQKYDVPDFIKNKDDKYIRGSGIRYCHDVFRPKVLELNIKVEIKNSILQTIDILFSKLSKFESLPKSLIHGDLNEMNALFREGRNVGIVDFGVAYEPVVYDLGEMCYWFAYPWSSSEFGVDRYNLIVNTFQKIHPLSAIEKELLPFMILRRSMMDIMLALQWFWNSPAGTLVPQKTLAEKIRHNNKILELVV